MILSEEQVDLLETGISKSRLTLQGLKDDLLDHLCCCVEHDLEKGIPFELAAELAFQRVCPNGAIEIERETIFLLNSKMINRMKKLMYFSGFFASVSMVVGLAMKILHWPAANNLFIAGWLLFLLMFLPAMLIYANKSNFRLSGVDKAKNLAGFSGAAITGTGIAFKLLHYPGADLLMLVGASLLAFGFLPILFFKSYRKSV
jgi:hypothetical protein